MRASRWTVLVAALIVAGILGLAVGTIRLSPSQVWDGLRGIGDSAFIVRGLLMLSLETSDVSSDPGRDVWNSW